MPLLSSPRMVIVNSAGQPYALAKMYTYRAGTLTNLPTYTDGTYGPQHTNPVVADANGVFDPIYIDPSLGYNLRIIIKDQNGVAIPGYDIDNIPRSEPFLSSLHVDGDAQIDGTLNVDGAAAAAVLLLTDVNPRLQWTCTGSSTNTGVWDVFVNATSLSIRTRTDAGGLGKDILAVTRSGTALTFVDIGNAADNPNITLNGVSIIATDIAQATSGTFTADISADVTTTVTQDCAYTKTGNQVVIRVPGAMSGTSDTTTLSFTVPAAIRPVNNTTASSICLVTDNGVDMLARVTVSNAGAVSFFPLTVSGTKIISGAFTNSGTKGIGTAVRIVYDLL